MQNFLVVAVAAVLAVVLPVVAGWPEQLLEQAGCIADRQDVRSVFAYLHQFLFAPPALGVYPALAKRHSCGQAFARKVSFATLDKCDQRKVRLQVVPEDWLMD